MLSGHHPLAVVGVAALAYELLQDGRFGLLGLEEQGIVVVTADEEQDPRPGANASHPDHLAGHLEELELLDQVAAVGLQSPAVAS